MTIEERLQLMLGQKDFQVAMLASELETAKARIAELETKAAKPK